MPLGRAHQEEGHLEAKNAFGKRSFGWGRERSGLGHPIPAEVSPALPVLPVGSEHETGDEKRLAFLLTARAPITTACRSSNAAGLFAVSWRRPQPGPASNASRGYDLVHISHTPELPLGCRQLRAKGHTDELPGKGLC